MADSFYQVREFAERARVTVRALHHYDHLGLLRPTVTTEAGYRLYSDRDFVRLQQIVTLKFVGFSLRQIREIIDGDAYDLQEMLRIQREIMQAKRRQLDLAIQAIEQAEQVANGDEPDLDSYKRIVEVINMETNKDFFSRYYTQEQLDELGKRWESEKESIEQTHQDWPALIREVEQAIAEKVEPTSERGRALAARWQELVERFTKGSPELSESLRKLYADQENWPTTFQKPYSDEVEAFIAKAREAK